MEKVKSNDRTMRKIEIKNRVIEIIEHVITPTYLTHKTQTTDRLDEDLLLDSLDAVEITILIEEEFGIKTPDDAIFKVKTVQDVIDGVSKILREEKRR